MTLLSRSPVARLVKTEARLMVREPMTLVFVFLFPVVTMLIIGGSFGTKADSAFDWTNPSHWYVASYFTVVIAATGLVMVPVHLASYRERGILRRFAVADFPTWSFAVAEVVTGLVAIAIGGAALLAVAAVTFGLPAPQHLGRVVAAVLLSSVAFISLGVILGSVLPSARSAQAVGLLVFFPSLLLGAGGPPPAVMGPTLRGIATCLPLTQVTDAIRGPWLGTASAAAPLTAVAIMALVGAALAAKRAAL